MAASSDVGKALDGLIHYYNQLTEPQLAFYHGCQRRVAKAMKRGLVKPEQLRAGMVWRDRWAIGGLGSGKTVGGLFAAIAYSALIPGNEGVIVRKRWEELKNHVIPEMYDLLAKEQDRGGVGIDPYAIMSKPRAVGAANEIIVRTTGKPSRIILKPEPDGPDRFVEDSFKGPEYGWFLLDEVTQLRQVTWNTLTGRLRRPNIPAHLRAGMAMGNPPVEGHWVYEMNELMAEIAERGEREDILIIRSTMEDNPFLDPDYVKREKRKYRNDPIGYAMYIEGQDGISVEGKPVFGSMFRTAVHVDENLKFNPFRPLLVGMDFGFHHPAAVFFQIDDRGRINILSEMLGKDKTAVEFAEDILDHIKQMFPKALLKHVQFFGDHAGTQRTDKGDTTVAILAKMGIRVRTRPMGIESGLDVIRDALRAFREGRPRLCIRPNCRILIRAMVGGYHYARMRGGQLRNEPKKDGYYDHVVDALRYGLANALGVYREPRSSRVAGPNKHRRSGPKFARGMEPLGLSKE